MAPFAEGSIWSVFGFKMNERRNDALNTHIDHWFDFTNMNPAGSKKDIGFTSPRIGWRLSNGVPGDIHQFIQSVNDQYRVGYFQAQESFKLPNSDLSHIRELNR